MISIIIPAYNSRATIVEALDSALAQTLWGGREAVDGRLATVGQNGFDGAKPSINAMEGAALSAPQLQDSSPGRKDFNIDKQDAQDKGFDELSCKSCISMLTPSYEVIIVDDGSKDDTVAVVERWIRDQKRREAPVVTAVSAVGGIGGQDAAGTAATTKERDVSRFTLITFPANAGPAAARNRGIREAQGEWIAFLDADDMWLPHKLEFQLHLAAQHPDVVLWCGECISFEEAPTAPVNGNKLSVLGNTNNQQQITNNVLHPITLEELALRNPIATSTVLVKRAALLAVGGFDEQFRGPEDYDLWIRVATYGQNMEKSFEQKLTKSAKGVMDYAYGEKPYALDFEIKTPAGVAHAPQPPLRSSRASVQTPDSRLTSHALPLTSPVCMMHVAGPVSLYRQTPGSLSMDDRKFLPQVLRVLDKAFGPGGGLEKYHHLRASALSSQYWSGSWMAFSRGGRRDAIRLWWRAWRLNRQATPSVKRPWLRMLIRYGCLPVRN